MLKKIGLGVLALLILFLLSLVWRAYASHSMDPDLGYANTSEASGIITESSDMNRQLKPCPQSPNCVATQTDQADKKMSPLSFSGDPTQAQEKLKTMILGLGRTALISEEPGYLHFTFKTWPIPFIDDVEFLFVNEQQLIHFRSASRVGYSDLGANRKRMKKVSDRWQARG